MAMTGDIDGDGRTDISDLELLKQVLKDEGHSGSLLENLSPEDRVRLDVNKDGQVNYEDVVKLYQVLLDDKSPKAEALADKFMALRQKARR